MKLQKCLSIRFSEPSSGFSQKCRDFCGQGWVLQGPQQNHKVNLETKYLTVSLPTKSTIFRLTKSMIVYTQVKVKAVLIVDLVAHSALPILGQENQPIAPLVLRESVEGRPRCSGQLRR